MKDLLRKNFLYLRNNRSTDELNTNSNLIIEQLIEKINWNKIYRASIYYPINNEVNILKIIDFLRSIKVQILLPVEQGFAIWNEGEDLKLNKWGAKEPLQKTLVIPDLAIAPLVSFNRKGYRIGYGSGFYDIILANMANILKIGVGYSFQESTDIIHEAHDIRLDIIITEKEFIKCI